MKRGILLIILATLMVLPMVSASLQHGVFGYVRAAEDGTSSSGATVTFTVFRGTNNYCNLTDNVGTDGNSNQPGWYAQDIGNCAIEWENGDIVYIDIAKGFSNAGTSVILTSNGSDQALTTRLSPSGRVGGTTTLFVAAIAIVVTLFILVVSKRKQKFKNKESLKKK